MIDRTLKVIQVSPYEAVTAMTVSDILDTVIPARSFLPSARLNPVEKREVERARELHKLIQRDFSGQKKTNARGDLAEYIESDWLGEESGKPAAGFLGPFIVWFPEKLEAVADENGGGGDMKVRITSKGIFVDGESRGEGFLINVERLDDENKVDALLKKSVAVHVVHGVEDPRVVAKYFADVNGKGIRVNPNLMVMADYTDLYAEITKRAFERLGLELETRQRQVSTKSKAVLTGLQARLMVAAIAKGVGVVSFGGKPIPSEGVDFEKLETTAEAWLARVFEAFPPESFRDKSRVLRAVPVTASLGALGAGFYLDKTKEQKNALEVLSDKEIDWNIGEHWNAIAGKVNPTTRRFTVGGAKEFAHATYRALTESDTEIGKSIRHRGSPVERSG
jgi:hypothetical protein